MSTTKEPKTVNGLLQSFYIASIKCKNGMIATLYPGSGSSKAFESGHSNTLFFNRGHEGHSLTQYRLTKAQARKVQKLIDGASPTWFAAHGLVKRTFKIEYVMHSRCKVHRSELLGK